MSKFVPLSAYMKEVRAFSVKEIFLTLFFFCCMIPVTIGDPNVYTVGINYSYVFYPLAVMLCTGKMRKPPEGYLIALSLYVLIYVVAATYQFELASDFSRRFSSFVLFISMFAFTFVKIDERDVIVFKAAIVVASAYFALFAIALFFLKGGASLGYGAKEIVGTQRYGFIHLAAFWILYFSAPRSGPAKLIKLGLILTVLIGLVLTFSRASIVALIASFAIYLMASLRTVSLSRILKGIAAAAVCGASAIYLLNAFFPIIFTFFDDRLLSLVTSQGLLQNRLASSSSSEGMRLVVWSGVLDYISHNPLTGGGFLGVWIIRDQTVLASAHDQYFDVLFRTGVIGFVVYVILLGLIFDLLRRTDRQLYWAFIGILIYGFFHETFKESQGSFILAFLLGMQSQHRTSGAETLHYSPTPPTFARGTG